MRENEVKLNFAEIVFPSSTWEQAYTIKSDCVTKG